ncbi:MAG: hypothetical protein NTX25_02505 [Proteobacteria bacterium]|nr:hypothetical protein [Pseudomonadota bacterium]
MKITFFASILSLLSFSAALAETLAGKSSSWTVPEFKAGFQYTVAARRSYTVTKYLNAAASGMPVIFSARCDGIALGEVSRFYDITQKNKVQDLSFNTSFTNVTCPTGSISFDISHPGLEVSSDSMSIAVLQIIETIDHQVQSITDQRNNTKQTELIKITSLLSNTAGSRESLHCLISSYEDDPLATGIVEELKLQYGKLYSTYVRDEISCPVAAQGALASNMAKCVADPLDLSIFCVVYGRYSSTKQWFINSITTLENISSQLDAESQQFASKIELLIASMKKDLDNTEVLLH